MSEVTKYQYFLNSIKLVLKLKNTLEESEFTRIVNESIEKVKIDQEISQEDELLLQNFLLHLKEDTFYDDCMGIYCKISKYEKDFEVNFLHFYKLKLAEQLAFMS